MAPRKRTRRQHSLKLAIAGGGTGGNVYPGIAVAQEIFRQQPTANIIFIGTPKGVEAGVIPQQGFSFESLEVREQSARQKRLQFKFLRHLPKTVLTAMNILKKHKPKMVLGIGGYVSVPVLYAAYLLHIPTMILETNRRPSLANRLLSRSVDKIAVCFEESMSLFPAKKVMLTGNPVRREFFLVGETPPPDKGNKLNVLVLSGGLGARSINYTMIAALDYLKTHRDQLSFTHQSGSADFEYVNAGYEKREFRAEVIPYIQDLPKMYAKSHLVIGRSGASMAAEIKASGRSAIVIPYPNSEQDQELNAIELKDAGIAQLITQDQLSGTSLSQALQYILEHPEELAQVWPNGRRKNGQDATHRVVEACLHLALGHAPYENNY
jgi:UDP-N-acetylglucosamine--N-acetylmuramyl-(pentapeptide) pyrophosphoryl-undecaprenol N-acetylglucosamine transferase